MTAEQPKSYGRTPSGVEITEEYIAQAVAEAEAGYDISALRRRPGGRPRPHQQARSPARAFA